MNFFRHVQEFWRALFGQVDYAASRATKRMIGLYLVHHPRAQWEIEIHWEPVMPNGQARPLVREQWLFSEMAAFDIAARPCFEAFHAGRELPWIGPLDETLSRFGYPGIQPYRPRPQRELETPI